MNKARRGHPPLDQATGKHLNMKTTEPMEEDIRVIGYHTRTGNRSAVVRMALDFYARALIIQERAPATDTSGDQR